MRVSSDLEGYSRIRVKITDLSEEEQEEDMDVDGTSKDCNGKMLYFCSYFR